MGLNRSALRAPPDDGTPYDGTQDDGTAGGRRPCRDAEGSR
jgi:hypothetical protein